MHFLKYMVLDLFIFYFAEMPFFVKNTSEM